MKKITIAGNPNSGKSTVFNNLTGLSQRTGNWPGVTVEKTEGEFTYNGEKFYVVDLPGTYGLSTFTIDEKIARDFLIKEKPDVVVIVLDSSNIERHFYLVTEILEMGHNVIIDLNMIDLAEEKGDLIDEKMLSEILGVPVVKTIANKNKGTEELKKAIYKVSKGERKEPLKINYGRDIEEFIEFLKDKVNLPENFPQRWTYLKIFSKDEEIFEFVKEKEKVNEEIDRIVKSRGFPDAETFIIEKKYGFIRGVLKECIKEKRKLWKRLEISDKIDRVITNPWIGIPVFLIFMLIIFEIVFGIGNPLADLIDRFIGFLNSNLKTMFARIFPDFLTSLLTDGIISGVGSVIVFLPNIFLLFSLISLMEDSGYMARAAFVMDRFMHYIGLHGKSFIPMILGFGCNVPAILATRTLESKKDRILTIMIIPLMSCSARLPIYILFTGAFFKNSQALIVLSLYITGVFLAIVVAKILSRTVFKKEESPPLVMELPPYKRPAIRWSLKLSWFRSKLFLRKAGTIIFSAVVIIWLLSSLPLGVEYASKESILGKIGSFIAPIFYPAGFGRWEIAVALLSGVVAKEVVVGTFGAIFGEQGLVASLQSIFTPLSAYAFILMSLIYIPCVATMTAIKNEAGTKYLIITILYTFLLGWFLAVIFYQIGRIFI